MYIQDKSGKLVKEDRIVAIWIDEQKAQVKAEVDGLLGHVVLFDVGESPTADQKDLMQRYLDRFLLKDSQEASTQLIADALEDLNKVIREIKEDFENSEDCFFEDDL